MTNRNQHTTTPLEKIIQKDFVNSDNIIRVVREYDFESKLFPGFKRINDLIEKKDFDLIPNIIGALLTRINDRLTELDKESKSILESLSAELFTGQIQVLNSTPEGQNCWIGCLRVLEETCQLNGYDYESLCFTLRIDIIRKANCDLNKDLKVLPYYDWLGSIVDFDELMRDIKSKGWICDIREFKRLFKPIEDNEYCYRSSKNYIDELLILFSTLKSEGLIQPRRISGHFSPLHRYGVDHDEKLFDKEPKRYMANLNKNKARKKRIRKEVEQLLRYIDRGENRL
ncbi:MAG: hypothetical protein COA32_16510 [Fluviicola sp.]|nr:MAG: hypothetical protein COA32_16510 [Fluviicola sp.]